MGRAIAAILAAWVLWSTLWIGMNIGAEALLPDLIDSARRLEHPGVLSFYVVWSVVASLAAGYVCAWIGQASATKAVWALAIIQLVLGIGIEASVWDMVPVWYHLVFLALLVPATVYGGKLRADRRSAGTR